MGAGLGQEMTVRSGLCLDRLVKDAAGLEDWMGVVPYTVDIRTSFDLFLRTERYRTFPVSSL